MSQLVGCEGGHLYETDGAAGTGLTRPRCARCGVVRISFGAQGGELHSSSLFSGGRARTVFDLVAPETAPQPEKASSNFGRSLSGRRR
jgi:hypothetical protein